MDMTNTTSVALARRKSTCATTVGVHFSDGINAHNLIWLFAIGCVVGFLLETIFCLCIHQRLEVRSSFVLGPFNAVYGFGTVALYVSLRSIDPKKPALIFLVGAVMGTLVEFLCSWAQEAFMGSISWDYSHLPLNIGGRVCLLFTVFWGALALLWVYVLHPMMHKAMRKVPDRTGRRITWVLAAILLLDAAVSFLAITRWGMRMEGVEAVGIVSRALDRCFGDGFMRIIYPSMRF